MYNFSEKKLRVSKILIMFVWIMTLSSICFAQFGGGEGTADSPYQIATAAHLNAIRGEFLAANIHFIQTEDINLGEAPWNQQAGWEPIGTNAARFLGNYNGDGLTISGLTINRNQSYVGLFGHSQSATLRNITLTDIDVTGTTFTGGLSGRSDGTTVQNCVVSGEVNGTGQTGGITGYYSGNMTDTYAHVEVSAPNGDVVGGLIGNGWGNMRRCGATGNVRGRNRVGGLCGNDYNNHQQGELFATGNVTGNNEVGGLFGFYQTSTYYDVYATGNVTGNDRVGGLVGRSEIASNVHRAYAIGRVDAQLEAGGVIGSRHANAGTVNNSYWNVESTGQAESHGGTGRTTVEMLDQETFAGWNFAEEGGFWRIDEGSYPYLAIEGDEAGDHVIPDALNFPPTGLRAQISAERDEILLEWNAPTLMEAIGYHIYRDGERLNEEMLEEEEFADEDVEEWTWYSYRVTAVYLIDEEPSESDPSGALRVIITDYEEGDGSAQAPYTVANASQLNNVRRFMRSHFIQTEHIDMTEVQWTAIGSNTDTFQGSYNGDEYVITGLTIANNGAYQGLFGYTSTATLRNITLEDVEIQGGSFVGALAGRADNTTINGCSSTGTVGGAGYVGGLVGYYSGTMRENYSRANVTGTGNMVGGLIGDSWGTLHQCFATGNVRGVNQVGGLAGYDTNGSVNRCFATGNVSGQVDVGGLIGRYRTSSLYDSYATGSVEGTTNVGGLIGINTFRVYRSYSIGRVQGVNGVGGLIGAAEGNHLCENSYWNERTSGQQQSAGGEGRDERHMTYPYEENCYVGWDFNNVWTADTMSNRHRGYPYFSWQPIFMAPIPDIARNPNPANNALNIPADIDSLRWTYLISELYTNPVGFRVYFNTTGEFEEDDEFVWVPYVVRQEAYATADVFPEEGLDYRSNYFWKVVPTTTDPDDRGANRRRQNTSLERERLVNRGDAEDVPVWRFTTQINPKPTKAHSPNPEDEAEDVEVTLNNLQWSFTINQNHANPAGFRVYFNDTGDFEEDDDFHWVTFLQHQTNYSSTALLPEELSYDTTYYWKVVPTTTTPNRSSESDRRRMHYAARNMNHYRLDAEDVDVWSFTTISTNPNPQPATNPNPEHLANGISLGLTSVSWDYISSEIYTDPVGFRVYMNTTGAFGVNAPYVWVDYIEGEETYSCMEVVPAPLDANTTYFWRVIPTTIQPNRSENRNRKDTGLARSTSITRGDAQNSPVWRFTTGTTDVEAIHELPVLTELQRNYPNPFNPETTISFSLAEAGEVSITVYNSRGQQITTLINDNLAAGVHNVVWNGRDDKNREVGSGIYFYRMKSGSYTSTNKMILMK